MNPPAIPEARCPASLAGGYRKIASLIRTLQRKVLLAYGLRTEFQIHPQNRAAPGASVFPVGEHETRDDSNKIQKRYKRYIKSSVLRKITFFPHVTVRIGQEEQSFKVAAGEEIPEVLIETVARHFAPRNNNSQ